MSTMEIKISRLTHPELYTNDNKSSLDSVDLDNDFRSKPQRHNTAAMRKYCRLAPLFGILFSCIVVNLLYLLIPWSDSNFPKDVQGFAKQAGIPYDSWTSKQISNRTLGFEKIFVVGLPSRSDKRDSMQLAASLTNIDITWVDGVDGNGMVTAAVPPALFDQSMHDIKKPAQVGSWRGHMNSIRRVVDEGLQSALILEDDVDWDVNIITQLQQFANASTRLLDNIHTKTGPKHGSIGVTSPYGTGWDMLWLGHCGGWIPPADFRNYNAVIPLDFTVPPSTGIVDMLNGVRADSGPCAAHVGRDPKKVSCTSPRLLPDQRIVQVKASPICSFAYALSQNGARKALLYLGGPALADIKASFDTMLTEFCRGEKDVLGGDETTCLTVSPPYFVHHRPRGSSTGDSDISPTETAEGDDKSVTREIGFTKGIVFSTRLNAGNLIERRDPESQYTWTDERTGWRFKRQDEYRGGRNARTEGYLAGHIL